MFNNKFYLHRAIWIQITMKIHNKMITLFLCILTFVAQFIKLDLIDYILFGLPWSFMFFIFAYYGNLSLCFHSGFFQLICYYLTLKFKRFNEELRHEVKSMRSLKRKLIELNELLKLVSDYDNGFWSKVVTIIGGGFSVSITLSIYQILFNKSGILFALAYAFLGLASFQLISMVIIPASLLSHQIFKSYNHLNSINAKSKMKLSLIRLKVSKVNKPNLIVSCLTIYIYIYSVSSI
jgi:hypothetical protein